jgi:hypothetical protein
MKGLLSSVASVAVAAYRGAAAVVGGVAKGFGAVAKWAWNSSPVKLLRYIAGDPSFQRDGLTMEKAEPAPEVEEVDTGVGMVLEQQLEAQKAAEPHMILDYACATGERARQEIAAKMTEKTRAWCNRLHPSHLEIIQTMKPEQIKGHILGIDKVAQLPSMSFGINRNTEFDVARAVSQVRQLNREERRQRKTAVDPMTQGADKADVHKSAAKRVHDDQANGNRKPMTREEIAVVRARQAEQRQERKAAKAMGVSNTLTPQAA